MALELVVVNFCNSCFAIGTAGLSQEGERLGLVEEPVVVQVRGRVHLLAGVSPLGSIRLVLVILSTLLVRTFLLWVGLLEPVWLESQELLVGELGLTTLRKNAVVVELIDG